MGESAQVSIATTGMHCHSCSMLIEMNVGELEGVASVHADVATGTTEVSYDPAIVDVETILGAIRASGYGAEVAA
jgi:copper chaperone